MANFFEKLFKFPTDLFKKQTDFLGDILGGPDVPDIPPPPLPEPPIGIPETGTGGMARMKKLIRGGRGRTILAGQLTPSTRKKVLG